MSLTYNVRQSGDVTIIDLVGGMTRSERIASEPGGALHDCVRELVRNGHTKIALNLRELKYLDSSGVGELFGCFSTVDGAGGVLKLVNPTEQVRTVLRIARITAVLDVIEDETKAVRSFSAGSQ